MQLNTLTTCQHFLETATPKEIAAALREDQETCRGTNRFPSLLIHCLPPPRSPQGDQIARALGGAEKEISVVIARVQYTSIIQGIKTHIANLKRSNSGATWSTDLPGGDRSIPPHLIPNDQDFESALKVLQYLQLPPVGEADVSTPLGDVIALVQAQLSFGSSLRSFGPPPLKSARNDPTQKDRLKANYRAKVCYICQFRLTSAHPFYPSLCYPCGSFNIAESSLSSPDNLNLTGKSAVVTGGRVNLGYHTALRLLRCGAYVVVSTRYPLDAESKYLAETDSAQWKERLKVAGADFRTAADVFALVRAIKGCLKDWGLRKLDILVNNAAQTLTDSIDQESQGISREEELGEGSGKGTLVVNMNYQPRVRGGAQGTITYEREKKLLGGVPMPQLPSENVANRQVAQSEETRSSWIQRLHEIPYEDVISAHSVNTFVPLILLRELLPLMQPAAAPVQGNAKPAGYVINVSSRESLPERTPSHAAKAGHHVHTNMSKAALNMLTETEAGVAWRESKVAINTVDPGYMSADPQWMERVGRVDEPCPIGWRDGAGRVLWVVAKGEIEGISIWGRFLKHFDSIHSGR